MNKISSASNCLMASFFLFSLFVVPITFETAVSAQDSSQSDYVAYAVNDDGVKAPLPKEFHNVPDGAMVNVEWGKFQGGQVRLGIVNVSNQTSVSTYKRSGPNGDVTSKHIQKSVPVDNIEGMITTVAHKTNRFRVVERKELEENLVEQDLKKQGIVTEESGAESGKVLGAQYLLKMSITHYQPNFKGQSFSVGGLVGDDNVFGGVGVSSKKSVFGMTIRIIDATTSEVLGSENIKTEISKSGFSVTAAEGGVGGGYSSFSKTPIGQAIIASVNKGVFHLIQQLGDKPASGSVIKSASGKVYTNLSGDQVSNGEALVVKKKGEELVDPETGISLGSETTKLGTVKVTRTTDKFSIATPVDINLSEVERGAMVESTKTPSLRFADKWNGFQEKDGGGSFF